MWSMNGRVNGGTLFGLAVIGVIAGVAACESPAPTMPSNPYVGSWAGTLTDGTAGGGTWRMTLSERGTLTGALTLMLVGRVAAGTANELPAPPGSSGRFLTLTCDATGGSLVMNVAVDGRAVNGTYQSFGCAGFSSGSLVGQRQ